MGQKNKIKILIALIVAIIMAVSVYTLFSNIKENEFEKQQLANELLKSQPQIVKKIYTHFILNKDLQAGSIITLNDIEEVNYDSVKKNAFLNKDDFINMVLTNDAKAGELIEKTLFLQKKDTKSIVRQGMKAVNVPISKFEGISNVMLPNKFYDLYSASKSGTYALGNVKIVSCEFQGKSYVDMPIIKASTITFEIPASKVANFISNIAEGKLYLIQREKNDLSPVAEKSAILTKKNFSNIDLKNLPKLPPITSLDTNSELPPPISVSQQPTVKKQSIEVIEASIKSTIDF